MTDGEIAALNLESARRRAWARVRYDASDPRAADAVLEHERRALQFLGDLDALDRLETLAAQCARITDPAAAALVAAKVASTAHRFDDARGHLARAVALNAPREDVERECLTIDHASGARLDRVLAARRSIAEVSGRLEDLVPFGAALADLECFAEADAVYQQALETHDGMSPFAPAWVCFQLGMLWGEFVPRPDLGRAAAWYRRAIAYLPAYVKARVHLAEIYVNRRRAYAAEAVLLPALSSGDPEVRWRLGDVLMAQGRREEALAQLDVARCGFEEILAKHLLAFADHAAEFYDGSGNDRTRALELARVNAANRPTRRAVGRMHAIAAKCA